MNATNKEKKDFIRGISFSPDGKKIIFSRSNAGRPYMLQVYDLDTGELAAYQSPEGENWLDARYSFDGQQIVFIVMPVVKEKKDLANAQIAIMAPNGKNVRKITNTTGIKIYPSFSHSGKKVIFARPDVIRTSGRTPAADYDIYEVDVETRRETRLTHFKFFEISNPYYFPDDKSFVFWGESPRAYPAIPESENNIYVMKKVRKELESKYKHNSIYVMQANERELKPYLVMPEYISEYSISPSLNADGSVLIFKSIGYKPDGSANGWQLYRYSADGKHQQITQFPFRSTSILFHTVSPDGKYVAIVCGEQALNKIVIYQIKDGTFKEITLPDQPSRIVNN